MRLTSRALLSLIVAVTFCTSMFAATSGAPMIASANGATVNAAAVTRAASLRVGDQLTTNATGSAELNLGSSQVKLGHLTAASVIAGGVALTRGVVDVNGSASVKAANVTATATPGSAYELVTLASGRSYVSVTKGSVTLTPGNLAKPVTVSAGHAVGFDPAVAGGLSFLTWAIIAAVIALIIAILYHDLSTSPASSSTLISTSPSQL